MARPATNLADFDEIAVQRLIAGHHRVTYIHPADRAEVTRRLVALGYSDGQIAYRLGCWRRTVIRIRRRLSLDSALPSTGANRDDLIPDVPSRPVRAG